MSLVAQLKKLSQNDWLIGLGLFLIFLATNGYTYAWDDQHLEIPLLKSLIDPTLFVGDYYVEALKANFTSFLFPLLAKIITTDQVPTAYFILYLLSRFFLFFYAYKLWKRITRSRLSASLCVLSFFLVFRVEEFLYRTFSHQEFALAIIMAAIYYFYKNRFMTAAILFGVAANFHALYSFFPFCYMSLYLLWNAREAQGKTLLRSIGLFALFSSPFIVWTFKRVFSHLPDDPSIYQNWIDLYKIACPPTFLFDSETLNHIAHSFPSFLKGTQAFWPVIAMLAVNGVYNPSFRKDQKAHALMIGAIIFLALSFVFSYIVPSRFFLDLNLSRNIQFMQFILIGYTTVLVIDKIKTSSFEISALLICLFSLIRFGNFVAALTCMAIFFLLKENNGLPKMLSWLFFSLSLIGIYFEFKYNHFSHWAIITFFVICGLAITLLLVNLFLKNHRTKLQIILILVPFLLLTGNNIYYHYLRLHVETKGPGFWQLQRNWIDMQNFVREHTPKNALILTPNDMEMGGFRIFSERKVLVCYRDCGVIGFDYKAALEWQKRLKDVEHFKVFIDGDIKPALVNALTKYKVNYIVFMRYFNPGKNAMLDSVYENETFTLYRVVANPI